MRAGRLSASIFAALIACGAAAQTGPSPDPPATTDAATETPAGGAAPDSSAPPAQDTQAAPARERPSDAAPQTPPPATPTPPPTPPPAPPATAAVHDNRMMPCVHVKARRGAVNA